MKRTGMINAVVFTRKMLPLSLLRTAQNHPMLVELKNVICTSRDGDRFWRMQECYIRGSTIKYLRIPDDVIEMVKDDVMTKGSGRVGGRGRGRGGFNVGGRGRNRGGVWSWWIW
ncbi:LSM4 [Lepeophtheirus salmonis]|uniref:U6 snRNA-associated Sm-like protein LSm4 n=1 Tax=Lepeophtheirus salmonis TaxID=72036 RepID=A0A7R8D2A3_LEPSM|nr:LSM4 [Lepeophtheirus salmonis]CAF2975137.1 LSM4 [Lepeophtheirus salmonis]